MEITADEGGDKTNFVIRLNREELECLRQGLAWTIDQISGVGNIEKEMELFQIISKVLIDTSDLEGAK